MTSSDRGGARGPTSYKSNQAGIICNFTRKGGGEYGSLGIQMWRICSENKTKSTANSARFLTSTGRYFFVLALRDKSRCCGDVTD